MDKFYSLYKQYSLIKVKLQGNDMDSATNLVQYGITEKYFKEVDQAAELIYLKSATNSLGS